MSATIENLQRWYQSQCDGDWEHQHGVEIGTLDNPGWRVKIDLDDTPLEQQDFKRVKDRYETEGDWMECWKDGPTFHAACAPSRLEDALLIFLQWAGAA